MNHPKHQVLGNRHPIALITLGLLFALSGCMAPYQGPEPGPITLLVDFDGSPVKPHSVGGFNVSNAMNLTKIKDFMVNIAPPTYTWPAGNVGDEYELDDQEVTFQRLQRSLLPPGLWFNQYNLFEGSIEKALEQMEFTEKAGISTAFWHIGNEPDLYGTHRGAPEWTPEYYAQVFRQWVTAIKAVYPDAKFSGPTISNPYDAWMEVFIRECGDIVDVLSWHWYPTDSKKSTAEALSTSKDIAVQIQKYQSWLKDPVKNPLGHNRSIQTAVTEFAIHWNTNNEAQINDIVGALWTADVLGIMAKEGLDYSHFFCLGEYGGHAIFSKANKPRILYWVFDFYKTLRDGAKLMNISTGPDQLKVHGWTDANGEAYLVLVNHGETALDGVQLRLPPGTKLSLEDALTLTDQGQGDAEKGSYGLLNNKDGSTVVVTVPPLGIQYIHLQ